MFEQQFFFQLDYELFIKEEEFLQYSDFIIQSIQCSAEELELDGLDLHNTDVLGYFNEYKCIDENEVDYNEYNNNDDKNSNSNPDCNYGNSYNGKNNTH